MNINIYLIFVFLFLVLHCQQSTEPLKNYTIYAATDPEIRIDLLKRIYLLDVKNTWQNAEFSYYRATNQNLMTWSTEIELQQKLQESDNDIIFSRAGVLLLSESKTDQTENILIDFLNNHSDDIVRLNAARALAYRGNKSGLELLKKCAAGEMIMTSSLFEVNAAALALLILDEELPDKYSETGVADSLYLKL